MNSPVQFNKVSKKWYYVYEGKRSREYANEHEACAGYVNNLIFRKPKYKELFIGKTWAQIFKIAGIK